MTDMTDMTGFLAQYRSIADLPPAIPVFPLGGVLLLPRALLPLNVFEPRYLAMVADALAGNRLIGIIQPDGEAALVVAGDPAARPALARVGCVGRITAYAETADGRIAMTLTGLCRFVRGQELAAMTPYRQIDVDYVPFADDLQAATGDQGVDRQALLAALRAYLDANGLSADWTEIDAASSEQLVNSLVMLSRHGPADKQALLEAPGLAGRAALLVALTERDLSGQAGMPPSRLQ
jgi:uncharacterized protein